MGETVKTYRIKANAGNDSHVTVRLEQEYDVFDVLSLNIRADGFYRLHNSAYGVVVGRVLANNGFGIPNAKISIFIPADNDDGAVMESMYGFSSSMSEGTAGVRYNLLPDEQVADCHQVVGTFPNKRYALDNDVVLEVFEKYYLYTTRTNNAGDYMIPNVPVGDRVLHMDLDLSDCGILSQRPRDFVYKGYTVEQFENPNMFKSGTAYSNLSQIFTQDQSIVVRPFWGNDSLGETIGITRADINVAYKFEPTCIFMGSVVSDNASQGISKKCVPTDHMGDMDELVTGSGTIEMIRKTYSGEAEEFQVKGTELIDGNGTWCYQIPMNLDYMMTDEYGNMVPTDNPDKGIPTRARVRFRVSMQDMEENTDNFFRAKILVPHNPQAFGDGSHEEYDYEFGTYTRDDSFRDLFWNNVYTVKSYIPRFQKRKVAGWKENKFTGIKHCQDYGNNNPMPYNNMRIKLPFMYTVMCIIIKVFIKITAIYNTVMSGLGNLFADFANNLQVVAVVARTALLITDLGFGNLAARMFNIAKSFKLNVIDEGMCPDLENWYFAPMAKNNLKSISARKTLKGSPGEYNILAQTYEGLKDTEDVNDETSVDVQNAETDDERMCLTINTDYLISCIEMNLAQEYKVINFDFYNDWINGTLYFPRWMRYLRPKKKFLGITWAKAKVKGCMDNRKIFSRTRRYTQMCSLGYEKQNGNSHQTYSKVKTSLRNDTEIRKSNNYHKKRGFTQAKIFGKNGGICHEKTTMADQYVYYLKPCEWPLTGNASKVNLFATDIVLLGSLNECDMNGVPQAFKHLSSSSYIMPTNLALTNMEDSGQLYATDNGTMCNIPTGSSKVYDYDTVTGAVHTVDVSSQGSSPLTAELRYYSGFSENYDVEYNGDDSDTVAVTEAAGISWNWTGPNQGGMDKKKLYYPGGHFLGISCLNAQTNIKSCVNLERICEQGVSMSQRREDVRAVVDENGSTSLKYRYSVPSGLISSDDIIDDDFRVMFATMNHRRLIADKFNPKTGYKTYDFEFVNPISFEGALSEYAKGGTPYNQKIDVVDESQTLANYGINPSSSNDDYDPGEAQNTQVRTRETLSVDYYRFRFGLDYNDLTLSSSKQNGKFALSTNGKMYLPQYENSFYFYFGLRDGSTAMDRFNKDFFSQCETTTLPKYESTARIEVSAFDVCSGASDYRITFLNMEYPVTYTISTEGGDPILTNTTDEAYIEGTLPMGNYMITITDFNGVETTKYFSVGDGILDGGFSKVDFNNMVNDNDVMHRNQLNMNIYFGGYVECEGVHVSDLVCEGPNGTDIWMAAVGHGNSPTNYESLVRLQDGDGRLYLCSANTEYDLYIRYRCCGGNYVYLSAGTVTLHDTDIVGLEMGPVEPVPQDRLNTSGYSAEWWTGDTYSSTYVLGNLTDDNPDKWNVRAAIINRNCPNTSTTFSNEVKAVNGVKAVWGTPQNIDGVYIDPDDPNNPPLYTTEDYDSIPEGYTLDDEAQYWPNFGTVDYNKVHRYDAVPYVDQTVHGNFFAKVEGDTGTTKKITLLHGFGGLLRDGEGCMMKSLPDGALIPCIFLSGATADQHRIACCGDTGVIMESPSGVVYPTMNYPTVNKPFSVSANFFTIHSQYITYVLTGGAIDFGIERAVISGKCEGFIKNGLTFGKYYSGKSRMSFVTPADGSDALINDGYYDDISTVTEYMAPSRTLYLSGMTVQAGASMGVDAWTNGTPDEPGFSIVEGYPMYKYNQIPVRYAATKVADGLVPYESASFYDLVAEYRQIDTNANFYDDIRYMHGGGSIYTFSGVGYSDYNITYYLLPSTNPKVSSLLDFVYNKYIYFPTGESHDKPKHVFVAAYYTESNIFSVVPYSETVVDLVQVKHNGQTYYNAEVPVVMESNGQTIHGKLIIKDVYTGATFDYSLLNVIDSRVNMYSSGMCQFVTQPTLKGDGGYMNATTSFTNAILDACNDTTKIVDNIGYSQTRNFVIAGVTSYVDNDNAAASVVKLYMYPKYMGSTVVSDIIIYSGHTSNNPRVPLSSLRPLPTLRYLDYNGGEIPICVYWVSGCNYNVITDTPDDIWVTPPTGAVCESDYRDINATLGWSPNPNDGERQISITFYNNADGTNESAVTLTIVQSGRDSYADGYSIVTAQTYEIENQPVREYEIGSMEMADGISVIDFTVEGAIPDLRPTLVGTGAASFTLKLRDTVTNTDYALTDPCVVTPTQYTISEGDDTPIPGSDIGPRNRLDMNGLVVDVNSQNTDYKLIVVMESSTVTGGTFDVYDSTIRFRYKPY